MRNMKNTHIESNIRHKNKTPLFCKNILYFSFFKICDHFISLLRRCENLKINNCDGKNMTC